MENTLGSLIRTLRENQGLTQEELAVKVEASQQSVAKWESGKAIPRPSSMAALAGVLKTELSILRDARRNDNQVEHTPGLVAQRAREIPTQGINRIALSGKPQQIRGPIGSFGERSGFQVTFEQKIQEFHAAWGLPGGRWREVIQGNLTAWRPDFQNDKVVVEFRILSNAGQLRAALNQSIRRKLWGLATLRAHLSDSRRYALIIALPEDVNIDVEPSEEERPRKANFFVLQEVTAEAALLGITILLVRSPVRAAEMIESMGMSDEDNWAEMDEFEH